MPVDPLVCVTRATLGTHRDTKLAEDTVDMLYAVLFHAREWLAAPLRCIRLSIPLKVSACCNPHAGEGVALCMHCFARFCRLTALPQRTEPLVAASAVDGMILLS